MRCPKSRSITSAKTLIGLPVTALPFSEQMSLVLKWAHRRESRVVCVANVHMLIEAHRDAVMNRILRNADLVTPDGMPLVWMLRLLGAKDQDRVAGVDILVETCTRAAEAGINVYFLGSDNMTLQKLRHRLSREIPMLQIAGSDTLPFFRDFSEIVEDQARIRAINDSGAGIVFVSLGCPKQERWMHRHKDKINAVMIGLGGAFPVYAGLQQRAPKWVRVSGLEWMYRLIQEPRRLWKRYATTIPSFVWLAIGQLLNYWFIEHRILERDDQQDYATQPDSGLPSLVSSQKVAKMELNKSVYTKPHRSSILNIRRANIVVRK
jgi:N-acetylglucosaminyldiphosphoundecaprenol N-acetyl-beta-D-mannosaminyltransferase